MRCRNTIVLSIHTLTTEILVSPPKNLFPSFSLFSLLNKQKNDAWDRKSQNFCSSNHEIPIQALNKSNPLEKDVRQQAQSSFSETCSKMTVCHRNTGNQISVRQVLPCHKIGLINWMPRHRSFEFMCQTGGSRQASLPTMVKTCLCLKSMGDMRILSNLTAKNVTHLQKRSIWLPAPNSDNILSLFQFCAKFSNSTTFSPNILFTL